MEINDFLTITIVGAVLSFLIDFIKTKLGTDGWKTKGLVIALSIIIGGLYIWLRSTPYIETVLTVLGTASVVYSFFLKK